jgi:hypothetical protein
MRRVAEGIKKYWKGFDDSLINPPKEQLTNKNFKGQTLSKRKFGEGPQPTTEQIIYRNRITE